jgi:hypothetical protein
VSRGNREEKGSIATVRPTQLSVGCAVSVVAGGGTIPGYVTNFASRAAQAVVGGAAVAGARRALADRASDRACSLARSLANLALVHWLVLMLLWPELGHVLQPFVSDFSALKDVPLQLVARVVVDVAHIVTVLLPRGQECRGGKHNSHGTGAEARAASVMPVSVSASDSVDDGVSPRGVGRLAGWGCDGNNLGDILRCDLPSRRGSCV